MNGRTDRGNGTNIRRWLLILAILAPVAVLQGNTSLRTQDDEPIRRGEVVASTEDSKGPICEGFVTVKRRAQIPAKDSGVIERIEVEPGATVEEGAPLAYLDRARQSLERDLAQSRLDSAIAAVTEDATRRLDYAEAIAAEQDYLDRITTPGLDPDLAEAAAWRRRLLVPSREPLEAERLKQSQAAAEREVVTRKVEWQLANQQVEVGTVAAPFRGVVVQRFRQAGEWITAGDALCEMIDLAELKVEGAVRAERVDPRKWLGRDCEIEIMAAGGKWEPLTGRIDRVAETIDAAGRIKIEATFDNRTTDGGYRFAPGSPAKVLSVSTDSAPQP